MFFPNRLSFLFRINISKLPDPAPVADSMHCAHYCENGEALKYFLFPLNLISTQALFIVHGIFPTVYLNSFFTKIS